MKPEAPLVVHEWLTNRAGSERVVEVVRGLLGDAPVATTMVHGSEFAGWDVRTTPLQRVASGPSSHVRALPLMPLAWQALRPLRADLVFSSFHTFSLWAPTPTDASHIVYCYTPPRFLWLPGQLEAGRRTLAAPLLRSARAIGRPLDRRRAQRVPARWFGISEAVVARIRQFYGHDADLLYPPVDTARFTPHQAAPRDDHYLVFGRLVPYKRIDVAIEAFRALGRKLVIAGTGRDLDRLAAAAGPDVTFLGFVPEDEVPALLSRCRALVFPGEEDFGIVPVEAMAAGTPVIAFGRGGAAETVVDGETGVLFDGQDPAALAAAVRRFESLDLDRQRITRRADEFSRTRFELRLRAIIDDL